MLRSIFAVIAGFAATSLAVSLPSRALFHLLGTERTLVPGSYDLSALWIGASLLAFTVATFVGGYLCAVIARSGRAPEALAALVLVLGLLVAVPVLRDRPEPRPRGVDVSDLDAMRGARVPVWLPLANPVLGAASVLAGARLRRAAAE